VVTPKFKGKGKWTYSGKVKYGDNGTYTPDFVNQPGSIFLEYTLDGTDITIPASATLTYCSNASPHDYGEEDDDWGWLWWWYCPNMVSCAGDWCAFCNAYWFHYYHPIETDWPNDHCPLCGYGYYGHWYYYYYHYHCPEHPCWTLPELCADSDGNGNIRFRDNYYRDYPDDEAVIHPVPADYSGGCCPCPAHNTTRITDGRLVSASGVTCWRKDLNGNYTQITAGSPVSPGEAVYVRGVYISGTPWDRTAIFDWKDYGDTHALTCGVTVASVRVTPDDGAGGVYSQNLHAAKRALPPEGLVVAPAPGTLTPFWIHDDAGLHAMRRFTLTLDGTGTFKVWLTNSTNGVPLLVMGQTIPYDQLVSVFGSAAEMLWLEALTPGAA